MGAYQYLLNWHIQYYTANPPVGKQKNTLFTPDGSLTTAEKKRILINNIYGVDIDRNATEVTKLSLLLKCMEGETNASVNTQTTLFNERVLPSLENNIKSGNSLIDVDFYDGQMDFEPGIEKKIKPFNWQQNFSEVFKQGGFDCVIGNPPYIPIEFFDDSQKKYYKMKFKEVSRKYDTSALFTLKAFDLIYKKGLVGFISTQTWQTGENYNEFRKKLLTEFGIIEIINLPFNVFKDAYVDTGIFIYSKQLQQSYKFFAFNKKFKIDNIKEIQFEKINISQINSINHKLIYNNTLNNILRRIDNNSCISLGEISISTQGLSESRFKGTKKDSGKWILPFIQATIKRYLFQEDSRYFVELNDMQSLFKFYTKEEKILIRRIINRQDRVDATYFNQQGVFKKDLNPFIITNKDFDTKYVLGLINSSFFSWLYINSSSIATKDDFRQTTLAELRQLPIKIIDKQNNSLHSEIISLVDIMLQLNKEKHQTTSPESLEHLQQRIQYTDDKINTLVYKLYNLTEEEIQIIESK